MFFTFTPTCMTPLRFFQTEEDTEVAFFGDQSTGQSTVLRIFRQDEDHESRPSPAKQHAQLQLADQEPGTL